MGAGYIPSTPEDVGARAMFDSPYRGITGRTALKGQLHCHSTGSDGADTPTAVVTAYKNAGYDFVALTDHSVITADPGVAGITFIASDEEPPSLKHTLQIGASTVQCSGGDTTTRLQAFVDVASADAAVIIHAHPSWTSEDWVNVTKLSLLDLAPITGSHALEVYNAVTDTTSETLLDQVLALGRRINVTAVDDCHDVAGAAFNQAWVMVWASANTVPAILNALRRGQFYATQGPVLTITETETGMTVEAAASATFEWLTEQGVVQTNAAATSSTFTPTGNETFVRCRVTATTGGKIAWTNPWYVNHDPSAVRAGGPFIFDTYRSNDEVAAGSGAVIIRGAGNHERIMLHGAGVNCGAFVNGFGYHGTPEYPTTTLANDYLAGYGGGGCDNAHALTGMTGYYIVHAAENFTTAAKGTFLAFQTTAIGSTTRTEKARITAEGHLLVGTIVDGGMLAADNGTNAVALLSLKHNTAEVVSVTHEGYLGVGATPLAPLMVDAALNAGAAGAATLLVRGQSNKERVHVESYGTTGSGFPCYAGFSARGTLAEPTAALTDDYLVFFQGGGHTGAAFAPGKAMIDFHAAEDFTATNQGTYIGFATTPIGSTTRRRTFSMLANGNVLMPVPTAPANASAAGTAGEIAWDAGFIYVCTATNTWERAAIASW